MSIQYKLNRDIEGNVSPSLQCSDINYASDLAQDTELTLTVPGDSTKVYNAVFSYSYGSTTLVANSGSAITVAGAGSFAATNASYNPEVRSIVGGTTLRFLSGDTAASVGVSFYLLLG